RQAGPLPYRHVEHRERDRDTDPAIEHFVEKAVAWVVVLLAIALEVQLLKQVGVQHLDDPIWLHLGPDPLLELTAQAGDLIEIDRRTQVRVLFGGDQQRRFGQVQFRLRRLQQARERVACLSRRLQREAEDQEQRRKDDQV